MVWWEWVKLRGESWGRRVFGLQGGREEIGVEGCGWSEEVGKRC